MTRTPPVAVPTHLTLSTALLGLLLVANFGCRSEGTLEPTNADVAAGTESAAPHHVGSEQPLVGIAGLDLWSQGATVDLLLATSGEAPALLHRRSHDGGNSWDEPTVVPQGDRTMASTQRGFDPQITADGDRIVVAWTSKGTSPWGTGPIGIASSTDGGRSWRAGVTPADDRSTDGHGFIDLVVDDAGQILAVWLDARPSEPGADPVQGLRSARSDDAGLSWSANTTLQASTCDCCWNRLLVDGPSTWVVYRNDSPRDLQVLVSDDLGSSWAAAGAPGAFGWSFDGCPHVGGALAATDDRLVALSWTGKPGRVGLYVSSRDKLDRSAEEGATAWSTPLQLGGPRARHADLIATPRGDLLAVWDQPGDDQDNGLALATSADGGGHWTEPSFVKSDATASHPRAVATSTGVLLVWTELDSAGKVQWRSLSTPLDALR